MVLVKKQVSKPCFHFGWLFKHLFFLLDFSLAWFGATWGWLAKAAVQHSLAVSPHLRSQNDMGTYLRGLQISEIQNLTYSLVICYRIYFNNNS